MKILKWKYKDDERPKGKCYDCKLDYHKWGDIIISNNMWELINPTYHKGAGLLCPNCVQNRLTILKRKKIIKCGKGIKAMLWGI